MAGPEPFHVQNEILRARKNPKLAACRPGAFPLSVLRLPTGPKEAGARRQIEAPPITKTTMTECFFCVPGSFLINYFYFFGVSSAVFFILSFQVLVMV